MDQAISHLKTVLSHKGEMARLIAEFDWSGTLGPIEAWPASLVTTVGLMLHSPTPLVLLWGEDGIMIYNDAYSKFAGRRHPQLLGSKVREGWPEVADFNDNVMKVGLAGGTLSYQDQELVLDRSGTFESAWIDLGYSPVYDESGKPGGVIAIVVETTERVLTIRRAAIQNERRRQFVDKAPGFMIVMMGQDHVVEFVNEGHRKTFGSDDWRGKAIRDAMPGNANGEFFEALDHVFETGEFHQADNIEVQFRRTPDSPVETRYLTLVYAPIRNDDTGVVTGLFCNGFDVTERHTAEAARAESEDRLRLALSATQMGTFAWYPMQQRVEGDARMMELFGLPPGALQTQSLVMSSRIHPDDRDAYFKARDWSIDPASDGILRHEIRVCLPDGTERILAVAGMTQFDEKREYPVKMAGVAHDITESKLAEAALERRVVERTHELQQTQDALRQAQKMEAVGQLTGGIAHDFNNLLTGITGSLELLERRLAEGKLAGVERYIDAAQGAARRAAALTQRLLAFSRRQTLDPKAIDLNRLVAGMEDLIRRSVAPMVELEVVGAGGLWTTRVDPSQLENSLLNLCINARDAMAPDGGRLTIETANRWLDERAAKARDLPPGQYVSLCVTDTGTGMTPEVQERAFDPFYTTKPLGQGTGLGLSMVYGFVRQSGGQIRIYSELGKGTTMCLYLPRHMGPADEDTRIEDERAQPGHGETVLVIDDESVVRMLISEVLHQHGYNALEAVDGPSGMRILESQARVDLLITDVGLPGGMNGRQIADAARVLRPNLKVLFVTGYAENAVIGNGHLDTGMEVITKPFSTAALSSKIRDLIDRKS